MTKTKLHGQKKLKSVVTSWGPLVEHSWSNAPRPSFEIRQPPPYLRRNSVIYRGGSHVFAAVWDLRLVGVVGTADHWAGGREAVAPHHAATGLT